MELSKVQLRGSEAEQRATRHTLVTVLEAVLRLAHPIIPFITEELWQKVSVTAGVRKTDEDAFLMLQTYPTFDAAKVDADAVARMTTHSGARSTPIRNLRSEMKLPPSQKMPLLILDQKLNVQRRHLIYSSLHALNPLRTSRIFNRPLRAP